MAFTTVSRVEGGKQGFFTGKWNEWDLKSPYFYPEDVSLVLSQKGVVAIQVCPAKFKDTQGDILDTLVLIGLRYDENQKVFIRVDHDEALVGLMCGKYNDFGAIFDENAEIDLEKKPVPVIVGP